MLCSARRWLLILSIVLTAADLGCTGKGGDEPKEGLPSGLTAEAIYLWRRALAANPKNPSPVILVSRYQFERLRPFQSWQDLEALRDYVAWADRPEAVGLRETRLTADVSANDLILVRWPAESVEASVPVKRDPVGFAVLDPGRTGRVEVHLVHRSGSGKVPAFPADFPTAPAPIVNAVQAADAQTVVAYGEFPEGAVRVLSRAGEAQVLYRSANQINARVPSLDAVQVEIGGLRSGWVEVSR